MMIAVTRTVVTGCEVVILNVLSRKAMGGDVSVCSRIESGILLLVQADTTRSVNMAVSSPHVALHFHVAVLARNVG